MDAIWDCWAMNGEFRMGIHHQNALKAIVKTAVPTGILPSTGGEFSTGIPTKNALVGAVGPDGWRIKQNHS